MLTIHAESPEQHILVHMCHVGDVEQIDVCEQQITYRVIPLPHSYRRREVVIWTDATGAEYRARIASVSRQSIRIVTLDDGMVRNVDPDDLRYAYDAHATLPIQDLIGNEYNSTFGQALAAWLASKPERSCSLRAKRSYIEVLKSFHKALQRNRLDITSDPSLVAAVVNEWARQCHGQAGSSANSTVSPATFNQRLATVSSFYRFALQYNFIAGMNPIDLVKRQAIHTLRPKQAPDSLA